MKIMKLYIRVDYCKLITLAIWHTYYGKDQVTIL